VTDGRRIVVYEITGGNPPFRVAGNFTSTTRFLCLHEQTVYTVEPGKVLAHNYQVIFPFLTFSLCHRPVRGVKIVKSACNLLRCSDSIRSKIKARA
jgi:hypothetical protein